MNPLLYIRWRLAYPGTAPKSIMDEPILCHICGKQKGQPPERCNGHYLGTPSDPKELERVAGFHAALGDALKALRKSNKKSK